jgi:hypothetical protein
MYRLLFYWVIKLTVELATKKDHDITWPLQNIFSGKTILPVAAFWDCSGTPHPDAWSCYACSAGL